MTEHVVQFFIFISSPHKRFIKLREYFTGFRKDSHDKTLIEAFVCVFRVENWIMKMIYRQIILKKGSWGEIKWSFKVCKFDSIKFLWSFFALFWGKAFIELFCGKFFIELFCEKAFIELFCEKTFIELFCGKAFIELFCEKASLCYLKTYNFNV